MAISAVQAAAKVQSAESSGAPEALALEGVSHAYGALRAVKDLSLSLGEGEVVCLLGPSGCGKTTVLRLAAGLERLQRGQVRIAGRVVAGGVVAGGERDLPPEDRGVGLVFQDFALFPHLSVAENVAFGLGQMSAGEERTRVLETLEQVGMAGDAEAYPHMLSGGQQQRVALARALAPRPKLMLLDEPFSGLDSRLRNQVRDDTLHILKESSASTLMVTHDPEEAMFMADRIALMRAGEIVQDGTPSDLYCRPVSSFVASFFGDINRLESFVEAESVKTPFGRVDAKGLPDGCPVEILIRPEALMIDWPGCGAAPREGLARVMAARMLGRTSLVHLSALLDERTGEEGPHLHARVPGQFLPSEETLMDVTLDRSQTFVFPLKTAD